MTTPPTTTPGRHVDYHDGRQPPRWAVRAAHLITVLVLPSGLWRIGVALGFSMGIRVAAGVNAGPGLVRGWAVAPVLGLTVVSEGVGLLSLGLVRPWGEVIPRWIPVVGGHRVSAVAATVLAAAGAVALMGIWTFATVNFFIRTVFGAPGQGFMFTNGWWEVLLIACYLPLLLWGPLLLAVTWAYVRRRCTGQREDATRVSSGAARRAPDLRSPRRQRQHTT